MVESGELQTMLPKKVSVALWRLMLHKCSIYVHPTEILFTSAKVSLESRLKSLTHQAPVMVFMKVSDMIILQDIWWYSNWIDSLFRATHLSQNVAFQSSLCRFFRKPRFYWFLVLLVYVPWNKALIFLVSGSLLHLWHPHRWGGASGFEDLLQLAHLPPGLCQGRRLTIAQFTLYSFAELPFLPI